MAYHPEPAFKHDAVARVGVMLVNLGTPDAPEPSAVRRYLRQFLSDPRVVEIPRAVWWLVLNGIILNVRPRQSAAKYAAIWTPEGSPLRVHTERQAQLLKGYLGERFRSPIAVAFAMRYGNPSIAHVLAQLRAANVDRLLVLPLYPQYAASTTASAFDEVARYFAGARNLPELRFVRSFHAHPGYIRALAEQVRAHWEKAGRGGKLVMSFHGVPRATLDKGDPYHCECHVTARLLAHELGLANEEFVVTFQSRFGKAEWLRPYTAPTLEELARSGVQRVDVITPGFVADCLETLEEIAIEGRDVFVAAGGKEYFALPCLNESPAFLRALTAIAGEQMHGWVAQDWDAAADAARRAERKARATALGAVD